MISSVNLVLVQNIWTNFVHWGALVHFQYAQVKHMYSCAVKSHKLIPLLIVSCRVNKNIIPCNILVLQWISPPVDVLWPERVFNISDFASILGYLCFRITLHSSLQALIYLPDITWRSEDEISYTAALRQLVYCSRALQQERWRVSSRMQLLHLPWNK